MPGIDEAALESVKEIIMFSLITKSHCNAVC